MATTFDPALFGGQALPADLQRQLDEKQAMEFAQLTPSQQLGNLGFSAGRALGRGLGGVFGVDIQDPLVREATTLQQLARGLNVGTPEGAKEYLSRISSNPLVSPATVAKMGEFVRNVEKETAAPNKLKARVQALMSKNAAATETEAEAIASDDTAFREAMDLSRKTPEQQLAKQLQDQAAKLYPGDTASQVSWINQQKERGKAPTDAEVQDIAETKQANALINSRLEDTNKYLKMVQGNNPEVVFGPLTNLKASAEATGWLGEPSKNTQNQDNIRSYLTSGINAVLNAAKGVQARDDAIRAQTEIEGLLKLNTNAGARQALERLKEAQIKVVKSNEIYLESRARRTLPSTPSSAGTGSRLDELLKRASPEQLKAVGR